MILRCKAVRILCRIKINGSTDSSAISILSLGIHALGIEIHCQMILKERGVQVQSSCQSFEVRGLEDTLLVCIAYRHTIRQSLVSS